MTEPRQRQGRQAQTAQRRRRRDDVATGAALKLAIPPEIAEKLAKEGRAPRWVNDQGRRMHQLTKLDDYDKVPGVDPVPVGTTEDGKPLLAYLCSKPIEFIAEDRKKADARRRTVEQGMVKGQSLVKTADGEVLAPIQGQKGAEVYVVEGTRIGRGNQVIE